MIKGASDLSLQLSNLASQLLQLLLLCSGRLLLGLLERGFSAPRLGLPEGDVWLRIVPRARDAWGPRDRILHLVAQDGLAMLVEAR